MNKCPEGEISIEQNGEKFCVPHKCAAGQVADLRIDEKTGKVAAHCSTICGPEELYVRHGHKDLCVKPEPCGANGKMWLNVGDQEVAVECTPMAAKPISVGVLAIIIVAIFVLLGIIWLTYK